MATVTQKQNIAADATACKSRKWPDTDMLAHTHKHTDNDNSNQQTFGER